MSLLVRFDTVLNSVATPLAKASAVRPTPDSAKNSTVLPSDDRNSPITLSAWVIVLPCWTVQLEIRVNLFELAVASEIVHVSGADARDVGVVPTVVVVFAEERALIRQLAPEAVRRERLVK